MEQALASLRDMGASGCVLVGNPGFYGRFGFRADSRLRLEGVPPEVLLVLPIRGGVPRGEVFFHEAFAATS